eukprot:GHVS01015834.1.p1 GENE.GHVS01015834.1~~GHVS01015834.1.p1  ORF type:complete len:193 (+),score=19.24 GHVS01015834.1:149-727(+)
MKNSYMLKTTARLKKMLEDGRTQLDGMKATGENEIRKVIAKRVEVHKAGQEQYRIKGIVYVGKLLLYKLLYKIQKQVHAEVARRAAASPAQNIRPPRYQGNPKGLSSWEEAEYNRFYHEYTVALKRIKEETEKSFRGIDKIIEGIIRGGKEKETTLMKKISASIKAVTDTFAAAENEQRKEDTEKCILRCPA